MKIGVCVSGNLGLKCLSILHSKLEVKFILTDKHSLPILDFGEKNNIPLFVGNPRGGRGSGFLRSLNCEVDYLLSINYLFIIESDLINFPLRYAVNFHGSLLPKYRGRTPHVWAIINNETETGITAHLIEEGCDTGNIIKQKKIVIDKTDTGGSLLEKFHQEYPIIIDEVFSDLRENRITFLKQDETKATYFGKREPKDGLINWSWQKERIKNWVRAQAKPYPGAYSFLADEKIVIHNVEYSDLGFNFLDVDGCILYVENNEFFVKTTNGVIKVTEFENSGNVVIEKGNIFSNENRK